MCSFCLELCLMTLLHVIHDMASVHICKLTFHLSPAWFLCHVYFQPHVCNSLNMSYSLNTFVSLPTQHPILGITAILPSSIAQYYAFLQLKSAFTFSGSFSCFSQVRWLSSLRLGLLFHVFFFLSVISRFPLSQHSSHCFKVVCVFICLRH